MHASQPRSALRSALRPTGSSGQGVWQRPVLDDVWFAILCLFHITAISRELPPLIILINMRGENEIPPPKSDVGGEEKEIKSQEASSLRTGWLDHDETKTFLRKGLRCNR